MQYIPVYFVLILKLVAADFQQWLRLSLCKPDNGNNTANIAYAVYQVDTCLPGTTDFYMWSLSKTEAASEHEYPFQYVIFFDSSCTDENLEQSAAVAIQKSCVPVIPEGAHGPVYDVLYRGEVLDYLPDVPKVMSCLP